MKPKYVIFDCDGVLVDSEILANQVEVEVKTELGFPITLEEQIRKFTGLSSSHPLVKEDIARYPAEYLKIVDQRIQSRYETDLHAIPGVADVLENLNLPKCVASNSGLDWIVRKLAFTKLLHHFPQSIFSGHMVRKGKPAPDLFFYAAKTKNWNPADCVVIEDSLPGAQGALAAGMRVLGFVGGKHILPGHSEKLKDLGCIQVFSEMSDLPKIIETL